MISLTFCLISPPHSYFLSFSLQLYFPSLPFFHFLLVLFSKLIISIRRSQISVYHAERKKKRLQERRWNKQTDCNSAEGVAVKSKRGKKRRSKVGKSEKWQLKWTRRIVSQRAAALLTSHHLQSASNVITVSVCFCILSFSSLNSDYCLTCLSCYLCLIFLPPLHFPTTCQSSSVSGIALSPGWACQTEQDTLYSSSHPGSCNETLISCICLSPDSGVRRMLSKCVLCPRLGGGELTSTSAQCTTSAGS